MLPNIGNAYSIQIVIRKSKPLERKGTTSAAGGGGHTKCEACHYYAN